MYEKPLIHRGDTLGARVGSCAPAGYSMLGLFGGMSLPARGGSSRVAWCGSVFVPMVVPGRALWGTYLERCCVHVCIQLCTRGYTLVYTRVYFSASDMVGIGL